MDLRKTRIAPTPSGYIHLGNALSFMITAKLAHRHHAKILLRIDDLDSPRTKLPYIQDIFDTLDFLEIPYDEGPRSVVDLEQQYSQHLRLDHYEEALTWLKETNQVFACDCSRKKVVQQHPKGWYTGHCLHLKPKGNDNALCWRCKASDKKKLEWKGTDARIRENFLPSSMNYFVVRKKDKMPSYQLASLVDDLFFGVDLVIRGEDLMPSTLAQVYLSQLLPKNNFTKATFYHHPLVHHNNRKLSKSDGADAIRNMRKSGMKKASIYQEIGKYLAIKEPINNLEGFIRHSQF
ncbi:MAG: glutamate--tRNA ligase family protein [Cyclobacteriaceae bacterium]